MDGRVFDEVTRAAGGARSRRGVLRMLAGAAVAAGIARVRPAAAADEERKEKGDGKGAKKRCAKLKKACGGPQKPKCCKGSVCRNGKCSCPNGTTQVGNKCVPVPECENNADCGANEICQSGTCQPAPPECVADDDCGDNEACQGGTCVCDEVEDGRCIRRCDSQADCPGFPSCRNLSPSQNPFIEDGVCVDEPFLLCDVSACSTNSQCAGDEVCVMTGCGSGSALVGRCFPFSVF